MPLLYLGWLGLPLEEWVEVLMGFFLREDHCRTDFIPGVVSIEVIDEVKGRRRSSNAHVS